MLRTKKLTNSKGLKFDDNEGLNVSRRRGMSRGNRRNSIGGGKSKYKCFNCHKINHFKRDYLECGDNDNILFMNFM
jgi:hypothetical protein